jgi:apoptosis-stimulating of p53 protein 1
MANQQQQQQQHHFQHTVPTKLSKIVEASNESAKHLNVSNNNNTATNQAVIAEKNSAPLPMAQTPSPPPVSAPNPMVSSTPSNVAVQPQPPTVPTTAPSQLQTQIIPIVTNLTSTNVSIQQNNSLQNPQQQQQQQQQPKLTTFLPAAAAPKETREQQQAQNQTIEQQSANIEVVHNEQPPNVTTKSTKSIIKQTTVVSLNGEHQGENTEYVSSNPNNNSRRVNFDPHALLLDAAVEGELDLVAKCAKLVRNISEPNDEGITALHNSVCAGHLDIVKFLVEAGCDVNYADNDGWTPLHCAASCNNIQMLRFLVENGASVFATTLSDNETAARKCEEDEDGFQVCHDYLSMIERNVGDRDVNGGLVYALYNYEKQNEDELRFECGQRLVVIDKYEGREEEETNDGWWTCRLLVDQEKSEQTESGSNTNTGLVPKNYLGVSSLF